MVAERREKERKKRRHERKKSRHVSSLSFRLRTRWQASTCAIRRPPRRAGSAKSPCWSGWRRSGASKRRKWLRLQLRSQMPVAAFCYGSKKQLDCLARLELYTIEDMWRYIQILTPPVHDSELSVVIHKRHAIGFCTHRCNGIFSDFDKLYREHGVVIGGRWPNQWIALRTKSYRALNTKPIELPSERPASPTPIYIYIWVDDKDAIAEAIRQSLETMPSSPQLKSVSGSKSIPPKHKESSTSADGPRSVLPNCARVVQRPREDYPRTDIRTIRNRGLAFD